MSEPKAAKSAAAPTNEQIQQISITQLTPFDNHPFKVRQDEELQKLVESIKENGILIPAIARPKGEGYELIAGHRRKLAAAIAGLPNLPVLVRDLTDEQAVIAMVDSNVQRENVLPSEKAFAYKMKLEAVKRLPGRPKGNSSQVGTNYRADAIVAENTGESRNQIQRYIRLTELIAPLLKMVDERKMAFNPAVELSYLPKEQQFLLLSAMEAEQSTPSLSQAQRLKALSAEGKLTEDGVIEVMREQKGNQQEQVKIPYGRIRAIVKKDMLPKELEDFIIKAIEDYQKKLNKARSMDAR
jgi:ParB family chromosome partitioning protein